MIRLSKVAIVLAAILTSWGCSSDNSGNGGNDGGGGSSAGGGASTGATGSMSVAECGSQTCTLPQGARIERITTCCTDQNACGLKLPEATKCLPANLPGYQTASCPSYTSPDAGLQLTGCCSQSGCGSLDPFVGCILDTDMGKPSAACTYDPGDDCTSVTAVTCDGAEDCGKGQKCCGEFVSNGLGGAFTQFGCYDECPGTDAGGAVLWREMCHAGDSCSDVGPGNSCTTSMFLPASLTRCFTSGTAADPKLNKSAGRVNCGDGVCGEGQKCCVRPPHDSYCAAPGEDCKCTAKADSGAPESLDAATNPPPDASMNPPDASQGLPDAASHVDSGPGLKPDAGKRD
jgi:hypothetical protein